MPTLAIENLAKSYDGNPAVRDISFSVAAGRVLALCGENGAGKSTLMKMLSGATLPDSGTIRLDGTVAAIARPADAMRLGIRTVYQELSLLPHLSVAENILLGRMPTRGFGLAIDWAAAHQIAHQLLMEFGFDGIDVRALVRSLSVAQQQIVEIAKALAAAPTILILDEPTAVLSARETSLLFETIRTLAAGGTTVLYISHRLEEVFEIADDVVVLKDGRSVLQATAASIDQGQLIEAMVGRPLQAIFPARSGVPGRVLLEVERLDRAGQYADISLSVRANEIVGMFGLVGSGRTEVAKAIFGARRAQTGTMRLDGKEKIFRGPAAAVKAGLAMITEDRKGDGLALDVSVMDNASLASFARVSKWGVIDQASRYSLVEAMAKSLSIRSAGLERPVRQLSGGNQQKVVLAKWLLVEGTKIFIFDEPTRGVDIATKVEIYQMIADIAAAGAGVLLISSELPEVLGLSDRLLIMREGRIVAELPADAFDAELVFAHAAGLNVPMRETMH